VIDVAILHQRYRAFYAFDVVILLSSAKIGISTRSSALRRVQSMPIGAALGRLMRIAWVGVALETDGMNRGRRATSFF
jgi:hypothetical protein